MSDSYIFRLFVIISLSLFLSVYWWQFHMLYPTHRRTHSHNWLVPMFWLYARARARSLRCFFIVVQHRSPWKWFKLIRICKIKEKCSTLFRNFNVTSTSKISSELRIHFFCYVTQSLNAVEIERKLQRLIDACKSASSESVSWFAVKVFNVIFQVGKIRCRLVR